MTNALIAIGILLFFAWVWTLDPNGGGSSVAKAVGSLLQRKRKEERAANEESHDDATSESDDSRRRRWLPRLRLPRLRLPRLRRRDSSDDGDSGCRPLWRRLLSFLPRLPRSGNDELQVKRSAQVSRLRRVGEQVRPPESPHAAHHPVDHSTLRHHLTHQHQHAIDHSTLRHRVSAHDEAALDRMREIGIATRNRLQSASDEIAG